MCNLCVKETANRKAEAMRFVEGLTALVNAMGNPATLFKEVEALGFRHLDIEITSFLVQICPNMSKYHKAHQRYQSTYL